MEKRTITTQPGRNRKVSGHIFRQAIVGDVNKNIFVFHFSFPSPCVIVKGRQTSDLSVRKLFQSPMKFQLSPVKRTVRFSQFFKTKSLSFSSDYSPDSDESPLARMMVSPFEIVSPSSTSSTDSVMLKWMDDVWFVRSSETKTCVLSNVSTTLPPPLLFFCIENCFFFNFFALMILIWWFFVLFEYDI